MAKAPRTELVVEDVNGSFERLYRESPKLLRQRLSNVVLRQANRLAQRMGRAAPRGPDAPHIADKVTFTHRGMSARVGYIGGEGGYGDMPANDDLGGAGPTIAEVALYNEYQAKPGNKPFMRASAEAEAASFRSDVVEALYKLERQLAEGGYGL